MAEPNSMTAREWLEVLAPRVLDPEHQRTIEFWRRYYRGDHDLPTGPSQVTEAFRSFQKKARTNLCGLAVRSMADRMEIIGYRDASGQNEAMWGLWNQARMPARQFSVWRKALSEGSAFLVTGPDARMRNRPRVTIEGPDTVAVEHEPGDPTRRLAAVRIWHDPLRRRWFATVYVARERHYFQSKTETPSRFLSAEDKEGTSLRLESDPWVPREGFPEKERSTAEIPVIPFVNADEGDDGMAEFAGEGIDIQDRLNLSVLNRLTTERFQAYRQRALVNFVPEEDPATGLPIPPFKPGSDQVWTVAPAQPGDPEPKFVDLPPGDTANMLRAIESDMRAFAAATTTPVYYLPGGDMINLSGDAITALDAGHNAKIRQRSGLWGGPMAEWWTVAAEIAGVDIGSPAALPEAIAWARPDSFHPAAVADYVSKMKGAGVPLPIVAEEIGWAPARVEQLRTELAREELRAAAMAARAQTATNAATRATAPTGPRPPARPPAPGNAGGAPR